MTLASTLLAALDSGRRRLLGEPSDGPTAELLFESTLGVELPETSALLLALAALSPDEVLRRRVRGQVAARGHDLPGWLEAVDEARPAGAQVVTHVLGDGESIMIGVCLPGGAECTVVAYVDHNLGTLVKDAFFLPAGLDEVAGELSRAAAADPDTVGAELAAADARARVAEAAELSGITIAPPQTDTWPACRPLLEWVLRMLPDGGTGRVRPEWDDAARAALTQRFLDSPHGAPVDDDEGRSHSETIIWSGADYGPGDPLRWSPSAIDILLLDWVPRKIVADADHLAGPPAVLRAFVAFCHAERGIRESLTAETRRRSTSSSPSTSKSCTGRDRRVPRR